MLWAMNVLLCMFEVKPWNSTLKQSSRERYSYSDEICRPAISRISASAGLRYFDCSSSMLYDVPRFGKKTTKDDRSNSNRATSPRVLKMQTPKLDILAFSVQPCVFFFRAHFFRVTKEGLHQYLSSSRRNVEMNGNTHNLDPSIFALFHLQIV